MTDQPNPATPPDAALPPPAPEPATSPTAASWTEPSLPAVEPAEAPAPAEVVARDAGTPAGAAIPSRRASGIRWAIAIGGIAVVVGLTAVIIALAGGRPTPSIAVGYMPSNAVQYGEYRLDLPGDQRQKLASFLAKFPGFADQAAVQPKLYEVFDKIVTLASSNSQTFTTDIEPWFGGQIAAGSGPFDAAALSGMSTGPMAGIGNQLVVVTVKDAAKANAWIQKTISNSAVGSPYGGATLYSAGGYAAAVTDKVILGGSEAAVKAAVDTNGQGNLAADPEFKAAFASVSHDYVSFSFIDYRSLVSSVVSMGLPAAGLERSIDDALLGLVPTWFASQMRFENDAIVSESSYPSVDFGFDAKNKASTLAGHAPPSALFYAESHDIGAAQKAFLDKLRAIPELSSTFGQIDQSAGLIGGLDGLFGWWGDTAVVIGPDTAGSLSGGLLIAPTDAAAAKKTFETLRSFIVLGGGQAGIKLRDEKHGDATVTIIDFSAAMASSGGVPPGVKAEIAYTVTDDIVVLGYGQSFVNAVLDAGPGPSLADDARFKGLLDRVGKENLGLTFVDVQGIRGLVEPLAKGLVKADEWAFYEKEILPYLSHLDALVSSARVDGDIDRLPMAFTVK
jgi:hypothetical protein